LNFVAKSRLEIFGTYNRHLATTTKSKQKCSSGVLRRIEAPPDHLENRNKKELHTKSCGRFYPPTGMLDAIPFREYKTIPPSRRKNNYEKEK